MKKPWLCMLTVICLCATMAFAACGKSSETPATYTVTVAVNSGEYGTVSSPSVTGLAKDTAITVNGATITIGDTEITATATQSTAQYTYAFTGWTGTADTVTEDVTITANFSRTTNVYTVIWADEDGTPIETDTNVPYGTVPTFDGTEPTKAPTAENTYTFGWDKEIVAVTGDTTYTATYTESVRQYTITFENEDGTELQSGLVNYGTTPEYSGATPTKAATVDTVYTFNAWDKEIVAVTGDTTYIATFAESVRQYTIIFQNDDGTELQSGLVNYGVTPEYSGATPTKASDEDYSYAFDTWSPAIAIVGGDATYTATFSATEFNIISIDDYSETVIIGDVITIPGASIVGKVSGETKTTDGISISATHNGDPVDVSGGTYQPLKTGSLVITYSADGVADAVATITVENKVTLVDKSNLISKTTYVYYYGNSYYLGNPASAQYSAEKAYCIQLNCPSEAESYIIFEIEVGDVSAYDHLEMEFWALQSADGTWYVKTGNSNGTTIASAQGWRGYDNPVTVDIPTTAVSDGKLRLTLYQAYYNTAELYIQYIKGVYFEGFTDIIDTSLVNRSINPVTTYKVRDIVLATDIASTSATFNGYPVELPYAPNLTGTLTLNYEYCGNSKVFNVEIVAEETLVDTSNLIGKTTKVGGNATIGNVSGAQIGSNSAYCIKLPADYSIYYVTIDIDVGDVSDYDYLEIKFWALGLQGDTWYLRAGGNDGTTLFTAQGWRSWDTPVTLKEVSTSYVSNGKMRLTFTETWATGDELYIQYIKGIIDFDENAEPDRPEWKDPVKLKLATTTGDFKGSFDTGNYTTGSLADNKAILDLLYESGFRYVDLSMYSFIDDCDFMQDDWKDKIAELKAYAENLGMTYVQAHSQGGNPLDASGYDTLLAKTLRQIEICGELGIENIVVHAGWNGTLTKRQWFDANKAFFDILLDKGEECGVNILCENSSWWMPGYYIRSGADMREFIEYVNNPRFHACWDTGHGNCEDGSQYADIVALGDELYAIHFNDNMGDTDSHMIPYFGTLDCDMIIWALNQISYSGYFTFECDANTRINDNYHGADDLPILSEETISELSGDRLGQEKLMYQIGEKLLSSYDMLVEE